MTALQKLEAALAEHAKDLATHYAAQAKRKRLADRAWGVQLDNMGLAPDGELYATKDARLAKVREARK